MTQPPPAYLMYGQQRHWISENRGLPIKFEQYLQLLDWTGRQLRKGKRGAIPAELAEILTRLQIEQPISAVQRLTILLPRGLLPPLRASRWSTAELARRIRSPASL